ncbi:PP2C family protein-serine/threonine phosphatase [Phaeodactylibacter luteus]|uniref:Serine/threonine-protein phosphatase n=1 Tax=Phaeodactylibacter luteus TaxID=1564516 RepID=A0A5C6S1B1_9BACT|nr:protein phosphatase 2C domain-containing protein [Phaeodactylibacter luteus]TXB68311.1 serine/threonine-protein phosphatase [Phaeodactylibacter luteus]
MPSTHTLALDLFGSTDVGQARPHNEDNFLLLPDISRFQSFEDELAKVSLSSVGAFIMVADGMGGGAAGEVASEMAKAHCLDRLANLRQWPEDDEGRLSLLCEMIVGAHMDIAERALQNIHLLGMGTTATLVLILEGKAYLAWSGDSRVYRYNSAGVEQDRSYHLPDMQILIDEHSVVWDMVRQGRLSPEGARMHPESHIITQNLGFADEPPYPESKVVSLYQNDRLLVCSDGLNSMLSDPEIRGLLTGKGETGQTVAELIAAANAAGGHDNITVVLADVRQGPPPELAKLEKRAQGRVITQQLGSTQAALTPAQSEMASAQPVAAVPEPSPSAPRSKVLFFGLLLGLLLAAGAGGINWYWNSGEPEPSSPRREEPLEPEEKDLDSSGVREGQDEGEKAPPISVATGKRQTTTITWEQVPPDTVYVNDDFDVKVKVEGRASSKSGWWKVNGNIEKDKAEESERFSFSEPGEVRLQYEHNGIDSDPETIIVRPKPEEVRSELEDLLPPDWEESRNELLSEIERLDSIAEYKKESYESAFAQAERGEQTKMYENYKLEFHSYLQDLESLRSKLDNEPENTDAWEKLREDIESMLNALKPSIEDKQVPTLKRQ